jgi:hypothetical protein
MEKMQNAELCNLYSSPNVIRVMMGGVCSTHKRRGKATKFCSENREGRDHLGDLGVDGRLLLKWN